ncbi:MAG TPA: hypothetical protein VHV08_06775 [Pirellulales bacterium]|nr:hypothetical protein [Pirellulales bacterium]
MSETPPRFDGLLPFVIESKAAMSEYLLPCSCGRQVPVTPRMAGETIECACGNRLDVPTLRHMRLLIANAPVGATPAREWTNRHRLAFVWLVLMAIAAGIAAYFSWQIPPEPQIRVHAVDDLVRASNSPAEVYATFQELEKGIRPQTVTVTAEVQKILEQRSQLTWGIRIALGVCLFAAAAAAVTLLAARRPTRQHGRELKTS